MEFVEPLPSIAEAGQDCWGGLSGRCKAGLQGGKWLQYHTRGGMVHGLWDMLSSDWWYASQI